MLADLNDRCAIDFGYRVVGVPDARGIRVALLSTRRLDGITNRRSFPAQVDPVQVRDPGLDDPATDIDESPDSRDQPWGAGGQGGVGWA